MKRLIARFIRDNGIPDIIHVHSIMWGGIVGKWAHEKYNIPFIITEHRGRFVSGSGFHIPEGYKTTFSKVLKSTRRLILVSKAQEDYFKEFTDRISVIPNYVGNHFLKTRPKPNMGNPIKLINVCHLTKQKNVSTLIEALHLLRCKRKNVVLEIIGDGSERRPLEELVRHLDLTEYVSFHGAIKNDDLPALLKSADIFVLPSLFESFGIALVEAMACGLPVIGPKNGGPSYFINNQNGRIVDTTNIEEMAKAILSILDQNPDRLQIQQFVNEHFTKEKVLTEILNEYESAGNY